MAKRFGMGEKRKKPEDLTELERFLQLNRQVKPGSRGASTQIEHTGWPAGWWPLQDYDPIVRGRGRPSGQVGSRDEVVVEGPISGLLPEVSGADAQQQFIEEWTPYKEATQQMARDEEARAEAIRLDEKEKAYAEGRIYGSYQEDIGAKRQRYMDALKEIQSNSRRLNMIAGLTGGTSQADSFTRAALDRLEKMEEFSDDERLHQIRTGVYYDQNGNWHPPKSKKEAYNRAIQFGASSAEAAHISGGEPEPVSMVNWRYIGDDPNVQRIISRPRGDPPDDPEYVRYGGTADEAATSKDERHLEIRANLLRNGDILGAIQEEVNFIGVSQPRGDPDVHRDIATKRIWPLIPERMKVEEAFNSLKDIDAAEAELYLRGVRWVRLSTPAGVELVQLDAPIEGVIEEAEEEDGGVLESIGKLFRGF